jgi:hypothetical protein
MRVIKLRRIRQVDIQGRDEKLIYRQFEEYQLMIPLTRHRHEEILLKWILTLKVQRLLCVQPILTLT